MAMVLGAVLAHAQGTITIASTVATVETNGVALAPAGGAGWSYEVLDMTSTAYLALTAQQQASAYNFLGSSAAFALWTDSTVSGTGSGLHAGGITGAANAVASNWAAPAGATYATAPSYDYYTVLGWNTSAGTWATISAALATGTLPAGTWFGQTTTPAYNYAGGGPSGLSAADTWGPSGTGLAGSGGLPTVGALVLSIPEPTTLALAGLGGISMLFLRRRKA